MVFSKNKEIFWNFDLLFLKFLRFGENNPQNMHYNNKKSFNMSKLSSNPHHSNSSSQLPPIFFFWAFTSSISPVMINIRKKKLTCGNQSCHMIFFFLFFFPSIILPHFLFLLICWLHKKILNFKFFHNFIFSYLFILIIYEHFKHKIIIYIKLLMRTNLI